MHSNRRRFLSLAAAAAVAGCTGSDPESETTDQAATTTTATPTSSATPAPAAFQIRNYDVPDRIEIGESAPVSVTAENIGDQPGEFTAPLMLNAPDGTQKESVEVSFGRIEPNESVTVEAGPFSFVYLGPHTIRVGGQSPTVTVQGVPASSTWETAYRVPRGYEITVSEPSLQDTFAYEGGYDDVERRDPSGDRQWVFVDVSVTNQADVAVSVPSADEFVLVSADSEYDNYVLADDPINRGDRLRSGTVPPGETQTGWVSYAIASDLAVGDIALRWSTTTDGGEIAVRWSSRE